MAALTWRCGRKESAYYDHVGFPETVGACSNPDRYENRATANYALRLGP